MALFKTTEHTFEKDLTGFLKPVRSVQYENPDVIHPLYPLIAPSCLR